MRIALLTSSRFWRGSSSVFAVLARGLAQRGHTTTAVVAYDGVAAGFRERQLAVRTLPVGHTTLRGARALRQGLRDLAAEIVLVDRARDIRLAAFAALRTPLAVVYCISTPRPPRDLLTRFAFRRVALTVFLTRQLAERSLAEARFMRRAGHRVIPNGVDCDLFRPDEAAGRAFRQRHGLGDRPILVAVGALEGTLRAQARRLAVDARFIGELDPAQLVGAYNAATCIVHTRPDEVFALALIEALACGRPMVAAAGGGTPELVGDAGVLAPPVDPRAFAGLLQDLLGDPGRRAALGAAGRQRAVMHFSRDRMVRDYGETLEALGDAPRG